MKISTDFALILATYFLSDKTEFGKWFSRGFYNLELVVDITPSEYSAAIMEKAKTIIPDGTDDLKAFSILVYYFEKRLSNA